MAIDRCQHEISEKGSERARKREQERERERERDRQTDRQRDRQTDRQIDRQTDRECDCTLSRPIKVLAQLHRLLFRYRQNLRHMQSNVVC